MTSFQFTTNQAPVSIARIASHLALWTCQKCQRIYWLYLTMLLGKLSNAFLPACTEFLPTLTLCVIIQHVYTNYFFNESAFKHGIIESDIRMAFARPLFDGLIEGYDNKFLLFHAMRCRRAYRMLRNQD